MWGELISHGRQRKGRVSPEGTALGRQRGEGPRLASQAGVAGMAFYRNDQMAISAGDQALQLAVMHAPGHCLMTLWLLRDSPGQVPPIG